MQLKRVFRLFLWHAVILVVVPLALFLGILGYGFHWPILFFAYCLPVALIFPDRYRAHAAIIPEDGVAWALLVLFYIVLALMSSTLHALITRRRTAQQDAARNSRRAGQLTGL